MTVNHVGMLNYYPVSICNIMKLQISRAWLTDFKQTVKEDFCKTYVTTLIALTKQLYLYTSLHVLFVLSELHKNNYYRH